jgi:hypothetical protein
MCLSKIKFHLAWVAIAWLLVGCNLPGTPLPPPQVNITQADAGVDVLSTPAPPTPTIIPLVSPTPHPTLIPTPVPEPLSMPLMGVEGSNFVAVEHAQAAADAGVQIVRHNAVVWHYVEPEEGNRLWYALNDLNKELINLSERGIQAIVIVRGTPAWAQAFPGSFCGPILPEKYAAFASFMQELVQIYSQPPYNVKYWELGNEPDVDPSVVIPDPLFGCLGNLQDPYYGGGAYAEMLKVVYPAIKSVNPQAQVLMGGLLMDCDPTNPPEGKDCLSTRFLEGILANGGGDYFDIVSFHGYPTYSAAGVRDETFPSWDLRGGIVMGKLDYIRQIMGNFGIDKPIFHTEGGLICPTYNTQSCAVQTPEFMEAQAEYVPKVYLRNWANGVDATIWYGFSGGGWRYSALMGNYASPKPAYLAFKTMQQTLTGFEFVQQIPDQLEFTTYEFTSGERTIWTVWPNQTINLTYQLPAGVVRITDKFGNEIQAQGGDLLLQGMVYLEIQ